MKWMLLMKCIRIEMCGWSPLQRCVYVTCLWQCTECIEPSILYYHNLQIANRLAILEEIQFLQPASTICLNWCQIFWQLAVGSCCRAFILIALRLLATVLVFPTARWRSQRVNESRRCLPYEPLTYHMYLWMCSRVDWGYFTLLLSLISPSIERVNLFGFIARIAPVMI